MKRSPDTLKGKLPLPLTASVASIQAGAGAQDVDANGFRGACRPVERRWLSFSRAAQAAAVSRSERASSQKSPAMIVTFLVLFVAFLLAYGPRLIQVVTAHTQPLQLLLLSVFVAMLIAFGCLAAYFIAVVAFSLLAKPVGLPPGALQGHPSVAVLYPTCNDFQPEAAMTCLNQNYPDFHVFLLDDSNNPEFCAAVEAFHAQHPQQTTLIRRTTRQGFKAGNLNHALNGKASAFPFFAVVDADERLPVDFLKRTVPYLQTSTAAFVQANHAPNPSQNSGFAQDMGPTILPFWNVHCKPRNRFGFVMFLGHGALIRRTAWESVGGFPEIVLEDIAFSAALGAKGMRGLFLDDLVCHEDFPDSYLAFKRQHERFIIGTTQVLRNYITSVVSSAKLTLAEKVDFCLWFSPLYVPAACFLFLLLCSIAIPAVLGRWQQPTLVFAGHDMLLPPIRTLDGRFAPLWTWDFQAVSALCALSSALACILLGLQGRLKAFKLLLVSTAPYMSLMTVSWRGIISYLFLGITFSPPTGEAVGAHAAPQATAFVTGSVRRWAAPKAWEFVLGITLGLASLVSLNLGMTAISLCMVVGVGIPSLGWDNKWMRLASTACFVGILLQVLLNLLCLRQTPGLVPIPVWIHL